MNRRVKPLVLLVVLLPVVLCRADFTPENPPERPETAHAARPAPNPSVMPPEAAPPAIPVAITNLPVMTPVPLAPSPVPEPPPVMAGMDNEVADLRQQLKWKEDQVRWAEDRASSSGHLQTLLIALTLFGLPVSFSGGVLFARYKNYQVLNQTMRGLLERGIAVPPELLTPQIGRGPGISDFRKGMIFIWAGIGLIAVLAPVTHGEGWSLGLVPLFIGAGYLALAVMDRKKSAQ